jgi:hypothetical protein
MELGKENKKSRGNSDAVGSIRLSTVAQVGRFIYLLLAWAFLICILVQVFIAGMATFSDSTDWGLHKSFVKIFALVPLVMFLLTFVGSIQGRIRWISLLLFVLVIFQFLTVQVFSSISAITALHPMIALLLFWGSITTVKRAKKDRFYNI